MLPRADSGGRADLLPDRSGNAAVGDRSAYRAAHTSYDGLRPHHEGWADPALLLLAEGGVDIAQGWVGIGRNARGECHARNL